MFTATLDSTNCNKTRCYEKNPKSVEGECEEVKEGGRERERERGSSIITSHPRGGRQQLQT